MNPNDYVPFVAKLRGFAEIFERKLSSDAIEFFWESLKIFPIQEIASAMQLIADRPPESKPLKMPTPGAVRAEIYATRQRESDTELGRLMHEQQEKRREEEQISAQKEQARNEELNREICALAEHECEALRQHAIADLRKLGFDGECDKWEHWPDLVWGRMQGLMKKSIKKPPFPGA